jgi:hypothetical protein
MDAAAFISVGNPEQKNVPPAQQAPLEPAPKRRPPAGCRRALPEPVIPTVGLYTPEQKNAPLTQQVQPEPAPKRRPGFPSPEAAAVFTGDAGETYKELYSRKIDLCLALNTRACFRPRYLRWQEIWSKFCSCVVRFYLLDPNC